MIDDEELRAVPELDGEQKAAAIAALEAWEEECLREREEGRMA